MGIAVEFDPELSLRNRTAYESGACCEAKCLPVQLQEEQEYRVERVLTDNRPHFEGFELLA
jgi:hypothetical protein